MVFIIDQKIIMIFRNFSREKKQNSEFAARHSKRMQVIGRKIWLGHMWSDRQWYAFGNRANYWNSISNHMRADRDRQNRRRNSSVSFIWWIYECIRFFRLMEILVQIFRNFWEESADNVSYKALYMVFEGLNACKPRQWFLLPKIRTKLQECASNNSKYLLWGKGNGNETRITFFIIHEKTIIK